MARDRSADTKETERLFSLHTLLGLGVLVVLLLYGASLMRTSPWAYSLLVAAFGLIHIWGACRERSWWTLPGVVLVTIALAAMLWLPKGWRWPVLGTAFGLYLAGTIVDLRRDWRRLRNQAEREALREAAAESITLDEWVRTMGPLRADDWCEMFRGTPAGSALEPIVAVPFDRRKGADILECVRAHPVLRRIVEWELGQERRHAVRVALSHRTVQDPGLKHAEWQALYGGLLALLARHGRNDAFGEGDFWLIDDEVGECAHKIEVHRIEVVTRGLVGEIQKLLGGRSHDWAVLIVPSFDDPPLKWHRGGLIVYADRIEEDWDLGFLRGELGARLKW